MKLKAWPVCVTETAAEESSSGIVNSSVGIGASTIVFDSRNR